MLKRTRSFFVLSLAVAVIAPLLLGAPSPAQAQNRRVMLEEFTGAWCGWCPRGALALQQLYAKYPGQVVAVSIHNDQGNPSFDPMSTPQGDSLTAGIPSLSSGTTIQGFPDGWTARTPINGTWNVDPGTWIDTLNATGVVDGMVNQPANAVVHVTKVSFDLTTNMVTVKVTAKFNNAMSGDFRFNLDITEDSVSDASNTSYDQHNYFYHNSQYPTSPFYDLGTPNGNGSQINGFEHMHVFRGAAGPVWGTDGVIPQSVSAGATYSETYTFPLPPKVMNPNHVHLVGFVNQFSATQLSSNEILDAEEVPLTTTPIVSAPNEVSISANDGQYLIAHANGDTSTSLMIVNNGTSAVTVGLALDPSSVPAGWAITFNPASASVAGGGQVTVTMKISAPEQSAYVVPTILIKPQRPGEYIPGSSLQIALVSDNTTYAAYNYGGENAAVYGMPDTMLLHTAYMPLNANTLSYYDPSSSGLPIRLAMFLNDPTLDGGESVDGIPSAMQTILNAMSAGLKVYISSNDAMPWAFVGQLVTRTAAVQGFFRDSLGIKWGSNVSRQTSSGYTPFTITGTTDPIGAGMVLTANNTGSLAPDGETGLFSIPSVSPGTALFYVGSKTTNISVKSQLPSGNRVVYMGFALNSLTDQVKANTIFQRSIEWLMAGATAPVTGLTASPSPLDFGTVAAGNSLAKRDTITNTGSTSITINSITVNPPTDFSFSGLPAGTTIAPGQFKTMIVTFAPPQGSDGAQTATLVLNASEGSNTNIALSGTASSSGVSESTSSAVTLSASPNPFRGITQVLYTAAPDERNVSFAAYDELGREVAKLNTSTAGANDYSAFFDGSKLAAGTYVILVHSSKGTHEVRVVNQQ